MSLEKTHPAARALAALVSFALMLPSPAYSADVVGTAHSKVRSELRNDLMDLGVSTAEGQRGSEFPVSRSAGVAAPETLAHSRTGTPANAVARAEVRGVSARPFVVRDLLKGPLTWKGPWRDLDSFVLKLRVLDFLGAPGHRDWQKPYGLLGIATKDDARKPGNIRQFGPVLIFPSKVGGWWTQDTYAQEMIVVEWEATMESWRGTSADLRKIQQKSKQGWRLSQKGKKGLRPLIFPGVELAINPPTEQAGEGTKRPNGISDVVDGVTLKCNAKNYPGFLEMTFWAVPPKVLEAFQKRLPASKGQEMAASFTESEVAGIVAANFAKNQAPRRAELRGDVQVSLSTGQTSAALPNGYKFFQMLEPGGRYKDRFSSPRAEVRSSSLSRLSPLSFEATQARAELRSPMATAAQRAQALGAIGVMSLNTVFVVDSAFIKAGGLELTRVLGVPTVAIARAELREAVDRFNQGLSMPVLAADDPEGAVALARSEARRLELTAGSIGSVTVEALVMDPTSGTAAVLKRILGDGVRVILQSMLEQMSKFAGVSEAVMARVRAFFATAKSA